MPAARGAADARSVLLANTAWTAAAVLALVGVATAFRRSHPQRRRGWGFLVAATTSWLLGQLTWDVFAIVGFPGSPHLADAFWLAFAPLAAAGTYRLLPLATTSRSLAVLRLETGPLVIAVGTLAWALLEPDFTASPLPLPARITAVAYAALYPILPLVTLQALLGGGPARIRAERGLLLVLAGLTIETAGFLLWAPQLLERSNAPGGTAVSTLWMVGMLAIGAGALMHRPRGRPDGAPEARGGAFLPSATFIALMVTLMSSAVEHASLAVRLPLQVGVLVSGATLMIRGVLLTRMQRRTLASERAMHEELRRVRGASALFYEMSRDLLFTAADGYFLEVNPAWEEVLGWTREELLSRPFVEFLHPEDRDRTAAHAASLTGSEEADSFHNRLATRDGRYRWFSWASRFDEGVIYGRGADVTERRELEEELRRSNAELEQFAHAASHDLSEPLRSISGFSQFLEADYGDRLDDEAREYLEYIRSGTVRMRALIDGLLEYSRVGREKPALGSLDASVLLSDVTRALHAAIAESGASITHGPLPAVEADRGELARVLQNLVANAIKFTQPGKQPSIHVSASRLGEMWCLSVRDRGIGIDPRFSTRIFGMFKRLHQREDYPGTGVGLTIANRIVERHGGRIWVEPTPGGGSTFKFTLRSPTEVV
jgi:PAS domain S-box-containing protein